MDVVDFLKKNGADEAGIELFAKSIAAVKEKAEKEGLESKSVADNTTSATEETPVANPSADLLKAIEEQNQQFTQVVEAFAVVAQEIKTLKEQVLGLEARLKTGETAVIEKQIEQIPQDSLVSLMRSFLEIREQPSEPIASDLVKAVQPKQNSDTEEDKSLAKSLANPNFVFSNIAKNKATVK